MPIASVGICTHVYLRTHRHACVQIILHEIDFKKLRQFYADMSLLYQSDHILY